MSDDSGQQAVAEAVRCSTSDGLSLEAEVAVPVESRGAVVLAHPHPQQGGSMRSIVTSELFRSLPAAGIATLRFNFRGVEGSEGAFGGGVDERRDIVAAIDRLCELSEARPLVLAGWSFGADVSATVVDDRLSAWFLIAPPLRMFDAGEFVAGSDPRPKLLAVPEHDMFRPPDSAREATSGWLNTTVEVVAGADHFLVGRTTAVSRMLIDFVRSRV